MAVRYPALGDFCETAAQILGTTPSQIARLPNIGMAESALAAPRAGFDEQEAYPRLEEKAAILLERLARNHPLPDGNKRTAFSLTLEFLEANELPFQGTDPRGDVDTVERVAAGELSHEEIVAWICSRTGAKS